jgi:hypothetical protein
MNIAIRALDIRAYQGASGSEMHATSTRIAGHPGGVSVRIAIIIRPLP